MRRAKRGHAYRRETVSMVNESASTTDGLGWQYILGEGTALPGGVGRVNPYAILIGRPEAIVLRQPQCTILWLPPGHGVPATSQEDDALMI